MLCFLKLNIIIIGWLHVCSACSAGTGFELPDLSHWVRPIGLAPLDLFHWVCSIRILFFANIFSRMSAYRWSCSSLRRATKICIFIIQVFFVRRFLFAQPGAIPKITGADLKNLEQNELFLAQKNTGKLDNHALVPKKAGGF